MSKGPRDAEVAAASQQLSFLDLVMNSLFRITLALSLLAAPAAIASEPAAEPSAPERWVPLRLSLLPSVSTAGFSEGDVTTNVSLNLIAGHAGSLRGVEMGAVANTLGRSMHGVQMAGVTNVVMGQATGAQMAGAVNVAAGMTTGLQAAGVANVAGAPVTGVQMAGVANIARGPVAGAQMSGVMNAAEDVSGAQLGVLNIGGDVDGAQVGVVNIARRVRGVQLGVVNVADDVTLPIGLLSIVREGQIHLQAWASDTSVANVGLKLGSRHVYTLLAVGLDPLSEDMRWTTSAGLGVMMPVGPGWVSLDGLASNRYRLDKAENDSLLHTQVRLLGGWQLAKHLSVFAGPTLNVLNDFGSREETSFGSEWMRWSGKDGRVQVWPGLVAGIEI